MNFNIPKIHAVGIYNSNTDLNKNPALENKTETMFKIKFPIKQEKKLKKRPPRTVIPDIILCAKPGQKSKITLPCKFFYIYIDVQDGMIYDILMNIPEKIKIFNYDFYYDLIYRIFTYFESQREKDSILLQSLILELIYNLSESAEKQILHNKHNIVTQKVIDYINKNLTSELSLEVISRNTKFSPTHLHKIFKACTGKNLQRYIEDLRLSKAKCLLLTTELTLNEIALRCGFSSQVYFNCVFKRRMNMTPKQYVQKNNERFLL